MRAPVGGILVTYNGNPATAQKGRRLVNIEAALSERFSRPTTERLSPPAVCLAFFLRAVW